MTKHLKDIHTGEDRTHQIKSPDPTERDYQRAGLTLQRRSRITAAAEPLCRTCNAGPQCPGVDAGKPCPSDPTT